MRRFAVTAALIFALAVVLTMAAGAYAYDLSLSAEGDQRRGTPSYDLQAQVGQRVGDFRGYLSFEQTPDDPHYPNSPHNYRAGLQYDLGHGFTAEGGTALYNGTVFGYGRLGWQYDSAAKDH